MGKKLTTEEFIKRAREVHGDKYDYSKTEYVNKRTNVIITCPIHGDFSQNPYNHITQKQGCPECAKNKVKKSKSLGLDGFIKKAREIHGDNYDFSLIKTYKTNKDDIQVICNRCNNVFHSKPNWILMGHGCKHCQSIKTYSGKYILDKIKDLYDEKYKFPEIELNKEYWIRDYTTMICPIHGETKKRIDKILKGVNCEKCGKGNGGKKTILSQEIIEKRLKDLCGDKFDYDISEYKNTQIPMHFTCKKCNKIFTRELNTLMYNNDCPFCKKEVISKERTKTTEEFINQCENLYGNIYDYSETEYIASNKKIKVKCNECGRYFEIEANSHLQGHGCPYHYLTKSKIEEDIFNFINKNVNGLVIENYRGFKTIKELDIYVPSLKFAIELDGLYWHNELNKEKNYHLNKTIECEKENIHLFHIFEDEWIYKQNIVKSMLLNILGNIKYKIMARKCEIREVSAHDASTFLDNNHLQGKCGSSVKLGLYYNNELVSLMCFGKSRHFVGNGKHQWELLRFCNKLNTIVIGGASKLFKHFIELYNPDEIISYADRRWSTGNLYDVLGFKLYNKSQPNYYYVIGDKRYYRFNFRKSVLIEKYDCPEKMTEKDFCYRQKWYRIYDCGCLCYIWKKEN